MRPWHWEGLDVASASRIHAPIPKNGPFSTFVLKTLQFKTLYLTQACTIPWYFSRLIPVHHTTRFLGRWGMLPTLYVQCCTPMWVK